ncbi:MAG TPA: DMT family transporter [Frankiaceae bacterium]|nr:DMT family transporter [Frankiaceae bacterium]
MPAFLALLAALSWGLADFLGGHTSRRMPTALVMVWSQAVGLVCILLVLGIGGWRTPGSYLWWGVAAGFFGIFGTGFFYRALALGTMSVVAPIAGTGLVVPVVAGLAAGERPSVLALAGIGLAALGVILASGPELRGEGVRRTSVIYACCAAVGFGGALAVIPRAGEGRWAMTTGAMTLVSLVLVLAYVLARPPSAPGFAGMDPSPVVAIGVLNVAAVSLYAVSSDMGLVAVVSVLASLYPVVTVILAQVVYQERLRGIQLAGVGAALAGVVCLAAG